LYSGRRPSLNIFSTGSNFFSSHNQAVSERKVNIDPIVELDPKYHYANKVEKSRNVEELTPKDKEVKPSVLIIYIL
jgi:hypothetical protein